ncbi:MAG TPA: polysaccharide deacetylase family protein [Thermoanaerobaculia bacterium]|nr:polysaccharide deacetylase family protein [Thermoanaerobaculia bacterium]
MTTCHRHPERRAARKCFRCRRIVCVDCYYRRDAHIFCSRECHLRFRALETGRALRKRLAAPVAAPWFAAALALALVPVGVVIALAAEELDRGLLFPLRSVVAQQPRPMTAEIVEMEERETTMVVRGRTAAGAMVFLLRDGEPVGSVPAGADGEFRFEVDTPRRETVWAVAAVPADRIAEASYAPRERPRAIPRESVRSASSRFVESFTRGPADRSEVVLSFDGGSNTTGAIAILDLLRERAIRTTIFLTGEFIERNPDLVRRVVADGHEVGNHTWSHPHLTSFSKTRRHGTLPNVSRDFLHAELRRTADAFRDATGREMAPFWRAPFGEENSEIRGWAEELGYLHVGWTHGRRYNLDSLDWVSDQRSPIYFDPEQLADRLIRFGEANGTTLNGGIVLMHLGSDREENERLDKALPRLIAGLEERGMRFVKVSEMRRPAGGDPEAIGAAAARGAEASGL